MCAKLPCARNIYFSMVASDHVEYMRKSRLKEDKSKRHKNNKGSCGWK